MQNYELLHDLNVALLHETSLRMERLHFFILIFATIKERFNFRLNSFIHEEIFGVINFIGIIISSFTNIN